MAQRPVAVGSHRQQAVVRHARRTEVGRVRDRHGAVPIDTELPADPLVVTGNRHSRGLRHVNNARAAQAVEQLPGDAVQRQGAVISHVAAARALRIVQHHFRCAFDGGGGTQTRVRPVNRQYAARHAEIACPGHAALAGAAVLQRQAAAVERQRRARLSGQPARRLRGAVQVGKSTVTDNQRRCVAQRAVRIGAQCTRLHLRFAAVAVTRVRQGHQPGGIDAKISLT